MKPIIKILLAILLYSSKIISQSGLPNSTSVLFSGSGNCVLCHKSSSAAMIWNGTDVSPITYWRSTMMGNASKDPLWRAAVAEEVNTFPQHQQMIETACTKCHSPAGYTQAVYNGQPDYSMNELKQDPLANDGVTCTVCHQIKPDNFGTPQSYSGNYLINDNGILFGPYENSDTTLMPAVIGYRSKYSRHINQSELCATCHTLFTPTLDNNGNTVGQFPEQTPYLEWKNSVYPSQDIQCQNCHMPKIYEPIHISGMGNFPLRTPFWKHSFVGSNVYMLNLLKNNIDSLGITAEKHHFDSTISRTEYNLTEQSVELNTLAGYSDNRLEVKLFIKNLTGHKMPTGIPFRRMWIHLKVEEPNGDAIFESGEWDNLGKLPDYNSEYEVHYDTINSPDQVQVYEGVFADINQQTTYSLLKAAKFIKDNRIPPQGFSTTHSSYDSVKIYGNAVSDGNFNNYGIYQGTGGDSVTYVIPVVQNVSYKIIIELCCQSVKPELVDHLRTVNKDDVKKFIAMYDKLQNTPFIMKKVVKDVITGVKDDNNLITAFTLEQNYPNPFNPATTICFSIPVSEFVTLKVFDIIGNEVATIIREEKPAGKYKVEFDGSNHASGIYFYSIQAGEYKQTKKLILIK